MTARPAAVNPVQERALQLGIDLARLPVHVALIMDGNGRWAQDRGLSRLAGHAEGHLALRATLVAASELGIRYLTAYGFSAENWRRPDQEVSGIMEVIANAASKETQSLIENNVRARLSGRIHEMPTEVQERLREMEAKTSKCTGTQLVLALNYGGRAEIVDAIRLAMERGEPVDEDGFRSLLYLPDVPDPELVVRTSGEVRLSNFLVWQSAYSELVIRKENWPEFGAEGLLASVLEYQQRDRRFGGLSGEETERPGLL